MKYRVSALLITVACLLFVFFNIGKSEGLNVNKGSHTAIKIVSVIDRSFYKKSITESLNEKQQLLLAKVYDQVYSIPENKQIIDLLSENGATIRFVINPDMRSPGAYYKNDKEIHFKDEQSINYHVLVEEFFHAYQFQVKKIDTDYFTYSRSNVEFEAKVYSDFIQMKYISHLVGDHHIPLIILGNSSKSYLRWLNHMTDNFTEYPRWRYMQNKYYHFMEKFIKEKDAYNYPINKLSLPVSMFSILKNKRG